MEAVFGVAKHIALLGNSVMCFNCPHSPEVPSVASECAESDTGKDTCSFETQTELTMKDVSSCLSENAALKERLAYLEQELAAAKKKILETVEKLETLTISKLTRDKVMESDKTVKFYTGLVSVHMFNCLLNMVLSIWEPATKTLFDAEQQFILVLTRLRLGLLAKDLACHFGISPCSVSVIFHSWLDVLADNLRRFTFGRLENRCKPTDQQPLRTFCLMVSEVLSTARKYLYKGQQP